MTDIVLRAGLRPTGGGRSGCGNGGTGQVYVRRGSSNGQGHDAIMFSYYFPKVRWAEGDEEGHTHYFASVVVWLHRRGCDTLDPKSYEPIGLSYTIDHLTWEQAVTPVFTSGTAPVVQIHDRAMVQLSGGTNANFAFSRTLISWENLSDEAQKALTDVRYEKTVVPFTDDNFQALEQVWMPHSHLAGTCRY